MKFLFSLLAFAFSVSASAQDAPPLQSDTIPSAQLYLSVGVDQTQGQDLADLNMLLYTVTTVNGQQQVNWVDLSADETVSVSNHTQSVVFNPNSPQNQIPYVLGDTYTVTFKRYNGEVFTSQVLAFNGLLKITSPASGVDVRKSTPVDFLWTFVSGADVEFSIILVHGNCTFNGDLDVQDGHTTMPAGMVTGCAGDIQGQFWTTEMKTGSDFSGLNSGISTSISDQITLTFSDGLMVPFGKNAHQQLFKERVLAQLKGATRVAKVIQTP